MQAVVAGTHVGDIVVILLVFVECEFSALGLVEKDGEVVGHAAVDGPVACLGVEALHIVERAHRAPGRCDVVGGAVSHEVDDLVQGDALVVGRRLVGGDIGRHVDDFVDAVDIALHLAGTHKLVETRAGKCVGRLEQAAYGRVGSFGIHVLGYLGRSHALALAQEVSQLGCDAVEDEKSLLARGGAELPHHLLHEGAALAVGFARAAHEPGDKAFVAERLEGGVGGAIVGDVCHHVVESLDVDPLAALGVLHHKGLGRVEQVYELESVIVVALAEQGGVGVGDASPGVAPGAHVLPQLVRGVGELAAVCAEVVPQLVGHLLHIGDALAALARVCHILVQLQTQGVDPRHTLLADTGGVGGGEFGRIWPESGHVGVYHIARRYQALGLECLVVPDVFRQLFERCDGAVFIVEELRGGVKGEAQGKQSVRAVVSYHRLEFVREVFHGIAVGAQVCPERRRFLG